MTRNHNFISKIMMAIISFSACSVGVASAIKENSINEAKAIHYSNNFSYTFTSSDATYFGNNEEDDKTPTFDGISWKTNGIDKAWEVGGTPVFSWDDSKGMGVRMAGKGNVGRHDYDWYLGSSSSQLTGHSRGTNIKVTNIRITLTAEAKDYDKTLANYMRIKIGKGNSYNSISEETCNTVLETSTTTYSYSDTITVNANEYLVFDLYHHGTAGLTGELTTHIKSFSFDYEYDIPAAVYASEDKVTTYTNSNPTKITTTIETFEYTPVSYTWEITNNQNNCVELQGDTTQSYICVKPTSNYGKATVKVTAYTTQGESATDIVEFEVKDGSNVFDEATSIANGDTIVIVTESKQELTQVPGASSSCEDGTNATLPFTVVQNNDGTYSFKTSDNKYLSYTGSEELGLSSSIDNNTKWNVSVDGNGNLQVSLADNSNIQLVYDTIRDEFVAVSGTNYGEASGYEPIKAQKAYSPTLTISHTSVNQYLDTDITITAEAKYFGGTTNINWALSNVSSSGCITLQVIDGNAYIKFVKRGTATLTVSASDEFTSAISQTCKLTASVEPKAVIFRNGTQTNGTIISSITLKDEGGTPRSATTKAYVVDKNNSTTGLTQTLTYSIVDANPAGCVTYSTNNSTITAVSAGTARLKAVSSTYNMEGYLDIVVEFVPYVENSFKVTGTPKDQILDSKFDPTGLTFQIKKGTSTITVNASDVVFNNGNNMSLTDTSITATYEGQSVTITGYDILKSTRPTEKFASEQIKNADDLETAIANKGIYIVSKQNNKVMSSLYASSTRSYGVGTNTTNYTSGDMISLSSGTNEGTYKIQENANKRYFTTVNTTGDTFRYSTTKNNNATSDYTIDFDEDGNVLITNPSTGYIMALNTSYSRFVFVSPENYATDAYDSIQIYSNFLTQDSFAEILLGLTVCDATGNIPPNVNLWNEIKTSYAKMSDESKKAYAEAIGDTLGENTIASAVGRYDFIISKYNSDGNEVYEDFLGRVKSGMIAYRPSFRGLISNNPSSTFVIAIIGGITLVGGLSIIKIKRR